MKKRKKKASKSPTQLTLEYLRKHHPDVVAQKVEYWNPWGRVRKDLFGFIDILTLHGNVITGIQCTTKPNMRARVKKILEHENFTAVHQAGIGIFVWGWFKQQGRWDHEVEWVGH